MGCFWKRSQTSHTFSAWPHPRSSTIMQIPELSDVRVDTAIETLGTLKGFNFLIARGSLSMCLPASGHGSQSRGRCNHLLFRLREFFNVACSVTWILTLESWVVVLNKKNAVLERMGCKIQCMFWWCLCCQYCAYLLWIGSSIPLFADSACLWNPCRSVAVTEANGIAGSKFRTAPGKGLYR